MEFLSSCSFKPINVKEKMFSLEYNAHSFNFDSPWKCSMDCFSKESKTAFKQPEGEKQKHFGVNYSEWGDRYQLLPIDFPIFSPFSDILSKYKSHKKLSNDKSQ